MKVFFAAVVMIGVILNGSVVYSNESAEGKDRDYETFMATKESDREGFVNGLPEARRISLGRKLMKQKDPMIAYYGCGVLIRNRLEDEAIPRLSEMLIDGTNEKVFNRRMGYDWLHDDEKAFVRITTKMLNYLNANYAKYGDEKKKAIRTVFTQMGMEGEYNQKNFDRLILKLKLQH